MQQADSFVQVPTLLDLQEVAGALGCSRSSVQRVIRRGELPIVKIGRLTRVRVEDLNALVESLTSPARSPRR